MREGLTIIPAFVPQRPIETMDDERFRRLCRSRDYLAAGLARQITLADAAREACYSPFHFQRLFARAFGETPHEFGARLRIERAKKLLAGESYSVTEVCLSVGYSSVGSFSTLFRNTTGHSPSEYRRSVRRIFPVPAPAFYRFVPTCFLRLFSAKAQDPRSVR